MPTVPKHPPKNGSLPFLQGCTLAQAAKLQPTGRYLERGDSVSCTVWPVIRFGVVLQKAGSWSPVPQLRDSLYLFLQKRGPRLACISLAILWFPIILQISQPETCRILRNPSCNSKEISAVLFVSTQLACYPFGLDIFSMK